MTDTTTIDALYAACVAQPLETQPRLCLADALEEAGDAPRAEFIRGQIRLSEIGPEPRKVEEVLTPAGPDYWIATGVVGDVNNDPVKVGDRCDVKEHSDGSKRGQRRAGTVHRGLLVTRIEVEDPDLETERVTFKRDVESGTYPYAEAAALTKRCTELFHENWVSGNWVPEHPSGPSSVHSYTSGAPARELAVVGAVQAPRRDMMTTFPILLRWGLVFDRGLPSCVKCPWELWRDHGDQFARNYPICEVHLTTAPELQWQDDRKSNTRVFALARREDGGPKYTFSVSLRELDLLIDLRSLRVVEHLMRKRWPTITKWFLPGEQAG